MPYRSGGARGSYPRISERKRQADHTPLTPLRPTVLISESKSVHSSTWFPAAPVKVNVSIHSSRIVERDVPLYWINCERLPPKTAIFVWCRSNIAVVNKAQVDAQTPLPTTTISGRGRIENKAKNSYGRLGYFKVNHRLARLYESKKSSTDLRSKGGSLGNVTFVKGTGHTS
jgi:hypothetical protein